MSDPSPAAPDPSRARIARLLGLLAAGAFGLVFTFRLLAGGAAAEIAEPSINWIGHAFLAAALVLAALGTAFSREAAFPVPRIALPFATVVVTAWLSLTGADDLYAGIRRAMDWTASLAFFGLALGIARVSDRARAALLAAALAAAFVIASLALRERAIDIPRARAEFLANRSIAEVAPELESDFEARLFTDQASGPFAIPNGLGAFLAVAAVAAWGAAAAVRAGGGRSGFAGLVALALALTAAIALAAQKGSWLALAAGILVAVLAARDREDPRIRRVAVAVLAVLAVSLVVIVPARTFERIPGGLSVAVRKEYAVTALRMARERPLLGEGAGNFRAHASRLKPPRGEETRYAHDDYLELLAEQGPLAALALAAFWVVLIASVVRSPPAPRELSPAASGAPGEPSPGTVDSSRGATARDDPPMALALGLGALLGVALLVPLRLRHGDLETATCAACALALLYAVLVPTLERAMKLAPRLVSAGAIGGAGAFALQSTIDFLHIETGLLGSVLVLAAVAAPDLARPKPLPRLARAALAAVAAGAFAVIVLIVVPRTIEDDALRSVAQSAARRGDLDAAERAARAALEAMPLDIESTVLLGDVYAARARATMDPSARGAAVELYRRAISGRRGLADVKARLGDLLDGDERTQAYVAAASAYPGNPRLRFLAGRALAPSHPSEARSHLEAALALDEVVRHERLRLSKGEIAEALGLLDRPPASGYDAGEPHGERAR